MAATAALLVIVIPQRGLVASWPSKWGGQGEEFVQQLGAITKPKEVTSHFFDSQRNQRGKVFFILLSFGRLYAIFIEKPIKFTKP